MNPRPRPRWWILVLLLVLAVIAEIVVWTQASEDAMQQVINTWIVGLVTSFLLLVWWFFLSRLSWAVRLRGLAVLLASMVLFFAVFRYEGLTGDFIPRFSPRWQTPSEDRATARLGGAESTTATAGGRLEVGPGDWPGFRGPHRDGHAPEEVVRTDWAENPPQALWRHSVGPGWSSFAAVGDLLFTQEQRGELETVVAYEAATGEEVWVHTNEARHETFLGGVGPRATPQIHDSRLYALGATGILDCLDPLTGELLWTRDIVFDAGTQILDFGFSGSPLISGDLVVVNPGLNAPVGKDRSMYDDAEPGALIAYDRLTGEIVWKTGHRQGGYTAPRLESVDGVEQILDYSGWGLGGYDPTTGEELWFFEWINPYNTNSVQPVLAPDGGLFVSTEAEGSALVDVRQGEDGWKVETRWTTNRFKLRYNGAVLDGHHVYGLDGGILAALDLENGERSWKKGRYRFGQILLLKDHLLVLAENGEVVLLGVTPEGSEEVVRFQAIEGRCWNHPVVRDGILYVRSDEEAAAYDLRPSS